MARSPENARMKGALNEEMSRPVKQEAHGRRLKGPDGFVYVWTEALSKQPGFEEFTGTVDRAGFAQG